MGMLERRTHPLGDVLRMDEKNAVLATYYRNNVLHLFAMPSLVACAFLNNAVMRHEDIQRLLWRVYPYMRAELNLRWREDELPGVVDGVLAALEQLGLLERSADGVDLAALDDRQRGGGAALGARPGDDPGDRALLPRDRAAAARRALAR